jgi:hypothetical protein
MRPYVIWLFYFFLIILSLLILWVSSIQIQKSYLILPNKIKTQITLPFQTNEDHKSMSYEIILNSNIDQYAKINIAVDDIINEISVNNKKLDLTKTLQANNQTVLNDWKRGYVFDIPLESGKNKIVINSQNTGWGYSLKIKHKPFFLIWTFCFISIGLPLAHICTVLIELILKRKKK